MCQNPAQAASFAFSPLVNPHLLKQSLNHHHSSELLENGDVLNLQWLGRLIPHPWGPGTALILQVTEELLNQVQLVLIPASENCDKSSENTILWFLLEILINW